MLFAASIPTGATCWQATVKGHKHTTSTGLTLACGKVTARRRVTMTGHALTSHFFVPEDKS